MSASPAPSVTDLAVTVTDDTTAEPLTALLRCGGAGTSTHPHAEGACAAVAAVGAAGFAPVPKDAMCTQVYGGPETARVTGTVDGVAVDATFSRTNGCEIARWDALAPLFDVS